MNNLIFLVSISTILIVYGFYKILTLFWLAIIIYPRRKPTTYELCKKHLKDLETHFPGHPNLKIIGRYIESDGNSLEEQYICDIIRDFYFLKPELKLVLQKFRHDIFFLGKLFSSQ